jgi:hypothetical protein
MFCPSLQDVTNAVLALLPRGRAWQTHEAGPMPGWEPAFAEHAFNPEAFQTDTRAPSILWRYWRSFAVLSHYLLARACAFRQELWCATHSETHDGWMVEYGLPDDCDPFPDLCTKVSAIGGTRCEYYQEIAARIGWTISCEVRDLFCGSLAGSSRAGCAHAGGFRHGATIFIVIHMDSSPVLGDATFTLPLAGRMRAGQRLICGPNFTAVKCLLARVIHAEILTVYEARND